jgi:glutaryl-CoA dehydrogenase
LQVPEEMAMSSGPNPRDFLAIDSLLSDEERLVRDTVRRFVKDRVLPEVADWFEVGTFPKELAKEMGMTVPARRP